jgi:hypothetical protein
MPSKKNPLAKIEALIVKLDDAAAQAAKLLTPVAKALDKELSALDIEALPQGAVSDLMYSLRQAAKVPSTAVASFTDVFGSVDKVLEEYFIAKLSAGESSGVQGSIGRVQVTTSVVPIVNDWPAFYAGMAKAKSWDLLNKALNRKAVQERWEQKKQVPGVGTFVAKKVSVTKIPGR